MPTTPEDLLPLIRVGRHVTAQQVFEAVAVHLDRQAEPSTMRFDVDDDPSMRCAYRDPAGNKCAVGALIPDQLYQDWMDAPGNIGGVGVYGVLKDGPLVVLRDDHHDLLVKLQGVHDDAAPAEEDWKSGLREALTEVANEYDLDTAPLAKLAFA